MSFIRKPRYEISSGLGGDSELGVEKAHIGGYGGGQVGFGFGSLKKIGKGLGRSFKNVGKAMIHLPGGRGPAHGWRASGNELGNELGNEKNKL